MELRAVSGSIQSGDFSSGTFTDQPVSAVLLFGDDERLLARADVPQPDEIAADPSLAGSCRVTIFEAGTGSRIELLGRLGSMREIFLDMALELHRLQKEYLREAARATVDFGPEDVVGWVAPWGSNMPEPGEPESLIERNKGKG